jgi:archaellin
MVKHNHVDNGIGCTLTGTSTAATRPNLAMTINLTYVPVELTSFTANINLNQVELNWSTATETNNYGFEVERRSESDSYKKVGFTKGNGTTTKVMNYNFVDKNVTNGKYFYRLKQIDLDGTVSYSNEINAEVEPPKVFALEHNYPNPFNPSTAIKYSIAKDGMVNISIYNTLGEKIGTIVNESLKAGNYEVQFDARQFASGIYFYKMESGDFVSVKKMMLIK